MVLELLIQDLFAKVDFCEFTVSSDVLKNFTFGVQDYSVLLRVQVVRHPQISTHTG